MQTATSNLFANGLSTDFHPLTTPNTVMTDALNATFRTFNGNEMLLQNDMGNTLIQDSTTHNIMGLNDGFIPVGMKQYGGILYIASYNPKTKLSELGTIPSPVINYEYTPPVQGKTSVITNIVKTNNTIKDLTKNDWYSTSSFLLDDYRFKVGEQFMIAAWLDNPEITRNYFKNETTNFKIKEKDKGGNVIYRYGCEDVYRSVPMISKMDSTYKITGYFDCFLEAKTSNSADTVTLTDINSKGVNYYLKNDTEMKNSAYWFITLDDNLNVPKLNTDYCQADKSYFVYPNILPGYLYVKFKDNIKIDSFKNFNCYFYKIKTDNE